MDGPPARSHKRRGLLAAKIVYMEITNFTTHQLTEQEHAKVVERAQFYGITRIDIVPGFLHKGYAANGWHVPSNSWLRIADLFQ